MSEGNNDLLANIAKATTVASAEGKAKSKAKPSKKPAADAKPGDVPPRPEQPPPPLQPGVPCQVEGCPGRYSVLATRKVANHVVNDLICRTCGKKPKDPARQPGK